MDIIREIDSIIEDQSLLKHPFYQLWSDGMLTQESLAGYSKEYFQLVKAVPTFMDPIIQQAPESVTDELIENQQEESDHIALWIPFAEKLGISKDDLYQYSGLPATCKAVSDLHALMQTFDGGASAMYAFEKEIPKISQTKLDGLAAFYDIKSGQSTKYFELHTTADVRHAASWRDILEKSTNADKLVEIATKSVSAQNLLLDGCYEKYC